MRFAHPVGDGVEKLTESNGKRGSGRVGLKVFLGIRKADAAERNLDIWICVSRDQTGVMTSRVWRSVIVVHYDGFIGLGTVMT